MPAMLKYMFSLIMEMYSKLCVMGQEFRGRALVAQRVVLKEIAATSTLQTQHLLSQIIRWHTWINKWLKLVSMGMVSYMVARMLR